jgi:hypothetical protein
MMIVFHRPGLVGDAGCVLLFMFDARMFETDECMIVAA